MEKQIKKFSSDSNEDASLSLKEHVTVKTQSAWFLPFSHAGFRLSGVFNLLPFWPFFFIFGINFPGLR